MFTIVVMCDENVLSDCSMLCSSPISANILSNILIVLVSEAGM